MENEMEATTYGFGAGRLGFRDWASGFQWGFRVQGLGLKVLGLQSPGLGIQVFMGSGVQWLRLWFRVYGLGFPQAPTLNPRPSTLNPRPEARIIAWLRDI